MSDETHERLDEPHRGAEGADAARGSFRATQLIIPYLLFQLVSRLSSSTLEHARPLGITVVRFRVLAQLVDCNGMRIRDLVRECAVEQSAMSRVVDQLERDGMVSRKAGSGDNRAVTVWITRKGRATYESAFPHALGAVKELTGDLSAAEIRQLIGLLQRMLDSAGVELLPAPCFRSAAAMLEASLESWSDTRVEEA
jgi:DNA-binding MarR family transcriptional regulator